MKNDFRGWYETVQLSLASDAVDARWAAVNALAGSATDDELEALVRRAFRADQLTATTPATHAIRTKLADNGNALADEEFALLCAATLMVILSQDQTATARAATMISTAHFKGLRTVQQPMGLVDRGLNVRLAQARATRRRPALHAAPIPAPLLELSGLDECDADEGLQKLASACTDALQRIVDSQGAFEQRVQRYVSIQDEELQMLWWLQGQHSHGGQPFKDIPREERPFVLALDLAAVTYAIPGASAIGSLLSRAGVNDDEPLEIASAIQSLPLEMLQAALPVDRWSKVSPVTTPLHEGFKRRLEGRGENTWVAGWAGVCNIDATASLTPLQLAELCYFEHLLIQK